MAFVRHRDWLYSLIFSVLKRGEPELSLGKQVVELSVPYPLDDSDRRVLEALLPQLPPLSYPMSDEVAAAFLEAYRDLPGRPAWEPVLMTAANIEQHRDEQMRVMEQHQRELREAFAAGSLAAVDRHHVCVKALMAGTYLLREDAIAYLKERGLTAGGASTKPGAIQACRYQLGQCFFCKRSTKKSINRRTFGATCFRLP
jgi:hypothetical protein